VCSGSVRPQTKFLDGRERRSFRTSSNLGHSHTSVSGSESSDSRASNLRILHLVAHRSLTIRSLGLSLVCSTPAPVPASGACPRQAPQPILRGPAASQVDQLSAVAIRRPRWRAPDHLIALAVRNHERKLYDPALVGVPEMAPLLRISPGGRLLPNSAQSWCSTGGPVQSWSARRRWRARPRRRCGRPSPRAAWEPW